MLIFLLKSCNFASVDRLSRDIKTPEVRYDCKRENMFESIACSFSWNHVQPGNLLDWWGASRKCCWFSPVIQHRHPNGRQQISLICSGLRLRNYDIVSCQVMLEVIGVCWLDVRLKRVTIFKVYSRHQVTVSWGEGMTNIPKAAVLWRYLHVLAYLFFCGVPSEAKCWPQTWS